MNKYFIIGTVILCLLILVGMGLYSNNGDLPYNGPNLDEFAKCVADTGLTMYGAEWCAHCKAEKNRFGSAFKFIPYVECPDNPNLCLEKGVTGYPTWIKTDGTKFEGEQGLQKISEITSCPLPAGL